MWATIGRVMRGSLIEVMHSNFIRTASAPRACQKRVVVIAPRTEARFAAGGVNPGTIGYQLNHVCTGNRDCFSLPGLGKLIVNGAGNRDYTLVLGLVVLVVLAVTMNLLVDLAYALLDPKIRY